MNHRRASPTFRKLLESTLSSSEAGATPRSPTRSPSTSTTPTGTRGDSAAPAPPPPTTSSAGTNAGSSPSKIEAYLLGAYAREARERRIGTPYCSACCNGTDHPVGLCADLPPTAIPGQDGPGGPLAADWSLITTLYGVVA